MIKDNILDVKERIAQACSRINRDAGSVTVVAVSKGRTVEQVREGLDSGITDIGENRVQEALLKYNRLSTIDYRLSTIKWHMVGHLQTNKVKEAVRIFDLVQSVDSARLAKEIDKEATRINKIQDILIEVKTSPEATKFGLSPEGIIKAMEDMAHMKNINIRGLMTIAPLADEPQKARRYFITLREIYERVNKLQVASRKLNILSMGMSDDFEVAIEEGSTMVRIGRAIFDIL